MENIATSIWTLKEFKAYLYLYCALADHVEVKEERDHILTIIDKADFFSVHKELEEDTDKDSLAKIEAYTKQADLSKEVTKEILQEIMDLFLADGKFHRLEKGLFKKLQRILLK